MSTPERDAEVRRWLRYAQEDLSAAEAMLSHSDAVPRHTCFLAQQAAEKAIKTVLVFLDVDFPWRHDLDALRNLIPESWRIRQEPSDLSQLTVWAIEARYPGDWPDATEADAQRSVQSVVLDLKTTEVRRWRQTTPDDHPHLNTLAPDRTRS